jgi:hypothetical protein
MKLWDNRHSHLFVEMQNGAVYVEGNDQTYQNVTCIYLTTQTLHFWEFILIIYSPNHKNTYTPGYS